MNNQPIRQHWVPKAYLRAFCTSPVEREQIYAYDLMEGRSFKTSIANVAVKRNFYTLGVDSEQPSYVVETALSRIESEVKPVFDRINTRENLILSPGERKVLSVFLATMFMRTRQGLQMIHAHREEARAGTASPEIEMASPFMEELLALDDGGMRELFAKAILSVGSKLSVSFDSMHLRLLRAKESHLITSENPLVIFHPTEERWGIGTDGTHIHFSMSPKLVLHISKEPVIPGKGTVEMSPEAVQGLNGLTVLSAEQYLFSDKDFDSLRELLADRPQSGRRAFGPLRNKKT